MIFLWTIVVAFSIIAYITKSRTYMILALSALVNMYIDTFTQEDDLYLMVVYASIEFFTALAILYYGDIHQLFQAILLNLMIVNHYIMEYALTVDDVSYINSKLYLHVMAVLILSQLIGAGRGMDKLISLHGADCDRIKRYHPSFFDRKAFN